MRGIFIGRFQPIHRGHIEVIKHILNEVDEIIVLIAAAQLSHSMKNPLTGGERMMIVRAALEEENLPMDRVWIIPAQDVSDNSLWVHHLRRLTPSFDVMYSNNPFTLRLFQESGIKTKTVPLFDRSNNSATEIRKKIVNKEKLKGLLCSSTIRFLCYWDIQGRIVSILSDDTTSKSFANPSGSEMNYDK